MISRIFLVICVFISVAFWPENANVSSVLLGCILALSMAVFSSTLFCQIFIHSFVPASIIAYIVYAITAPVGDFAVASQSIGAASDSQFFLFEARRFINEGEIDALLSTWGSLIPVFFGGCTLFLFDNNFIGIVFVNCFIYSLSVLFASRMIIVAKNAYRFIPFVGWLPLQALYNAMLSKEPIYLFLIVFILYIFTGLKSDRGLNFNNLMVVFVLCILLMLLRPLAAFIVIMVCFFYFYKINDFRKAVIFVIYLTCLSLIVFMFSDYFGYHIPFNFSLDALVLQAEFVREAATMKGLNADLIFFATPPWSFLLSPVSGFLWMISPFPFFYGLVEIINAFFSGNFTFQDLARIIRYADSVFMIFFIVVALFRWSRFKSFVRTSMFMVTLFLVLSTVSVQFLESGRHRYLPGFVLAFGVIYSFSSKKMRN